jgi:uncharacterized protein YjbI with pentapeptide repeats
MRIRGLKARPVDLSGADFSDYDLSHARFQSVNLSGATFKGSNLKGVRFIRCSFVHADFSGADMEDVSFQDCRFEGTEFPETLQKFSLVNCTLNKVSFEKRRMPSAKIIGCTLKNVSFFQSDLQEARFEKNTSDNLFLPSLVEADLAGAKMDMMYPWPIGVNAVTLFGSTWATARTREGVVLVWDSFGKSWTPFDDAQLNMPEILIFFVCQMYNLV